VVLIELEDMCVRFILGHMPSFIEYFFIDSHSPPLAILSGLLNGIRASLITS
jgi:hypothetical protein